MPHVPTSTTAGTADLETQIAVGRNVERPLDIPRELYGNSRRFIRRRPPDTAARPPALESMLSSAGVFAFNTSSSQISASRSQALTMEGRNASVVTLLHPI